MKNLQAHITEIGIAQRIAHNIARYETRLSTAYTVSEFIEECHQVMDHYGIDKKTQRRIIRRARKLAETDVLAIRSIVGSSTHGGTECTASALLSGPLAYLSSLLEVAAEKE